MALTLVEAESATDVPDPVYCSEASMLISLWGKSRTTLRSSLGGNYENEICAFDMFGFLNCKYSSTYGSSGFTLDTR